MSLRRNYSPENLERVRELRRAMTRAEKRLWYEGLVERRTGFSFRKQYPLGPYSLDFYCVEARLCVELDGETPIGREGRDAARDQHLGYHGVLTLRFHNLEVFDDLGRIVEVITAACRERCSVCKAAEPPPCPPPSAQSSEGEALLP